MPKPLLRQITSVIFLCTLALTTLSGPVRSDETSPDEKPFIPSSKTSLSLMSNTCSVCHGVNGISKWPFVPSLAGQDKTYLENQLKAFRMRARGDRYAQAEMWGMAQSLKDEEIEALSEYFSKLNPMTGHSATPTALSEMGELIFKKGFPDRAVPACNTCHLKNGQGDVDIPRLAGQHADYLRREIHEFRSGHRANDIMGFIASHLSNDDIRAVSNYLASIGASTAVAAPIPVAPPVAAVPAAQPTTSAIANASQNTPPSSPAKKSFFFITSEGKNIKCSVISKSNGKTMFDCSILAEQQ